MHAFAASHDLPLAGPRLDQLLERMDINVALAARLQGTMLGRLLPLNRGVTPVEVFAVEDRSVQIAWACLPTRPG